MWTAAASSAPFEEACAKMQWQVHAYALMPNHFHLVIETPQANLVAGMKWLLGTYTGRFNRRHQVFGHLFSGRYKTIRRGWCLGGQAFRRELLAQMTERMGTEHYAEKRREAVEARAEAILAEALERQVWQEADLKTRPKGDPVKLGLTVRLRAETTLPMACIAERLTMGTRRHPNHLLYRQRKTAEKQPLSRPLHGDPTCIVC
jgi:REP element-mobilizing transposase RayT